MRSPLPENVRSYLKPDAMNQNDSRIMRGCPRSISVGGVGMPLLGFISSALIRMHLMHLPFPQPLLSKFEFVLPTTEFYPIF